MSKIQYESNKATYENLKAFIEEQVRDADTIADISNMRKWQEQLGQLTAWIKSEADNVCPIPESTWQLAGLQKSSTYAGVVDKDTSVENTYKELSSKVTESLADESKTTSLLRNYENLLTWVRDPNNANEAELHDQEIDDLVNAVKRRRFEKSRELLAIIQQTENLSDKERLIKEAESWNPDDREIAKEIDSFRSELARGISVEEIRQHLVYLQSTRRSNLEQFETSLRALEGKIALEPGYFSAEDNEKIEKAREYFDDLRNKGGQRTSMVAAKDLVETFIVYREYQQDKTEQVFFQDVLVNRADAEAESLRLYRAASQRRLQELISTAKSMASSSPTAAIAYLDRQLDGRIERKIGDSLDQIDQVPLTQDDKGKLVEYKEVIDRELKPKEVLAKTELELATKADSLFARVSHLIKSFTAFPMVEVQNQIRQLAGKASEERLNTIELQYEKLESDLERIKEMHLGSISEAIKKLRDHLHNFDTMLTQDWFGVPIYEVVSKTEALAGLSLSAKPLELNDYSPRGGKRKDIEKAILDVESAVETIRQVTTAVEQRLKDIPPDINGAIQEFNAIRDRLDLAPYRGFKDLEKLVSQHQELIEKRNRLQQFLETYKYRELLDYYYSNVSMTKDYLNASQAEKSEIIKILREAELEAHTLLLEKYFKAGNYKAAQIELNWLRDHKMITERNQAIISQLEKIIEESGALEEFYLNAFVTIGIRQDELLPTIFSLLPSVLSSMQEGSVSQTVDDELRLLLDDSLTSIDETKIHKRFLGQISKYNFQRVDEFMRKVFYCGGDKVEKDPKWPALVEHSVIEHDARSLGLVLRDLIKDRIHHELVSLGGKGRATLGELKGPLLAYKELPLHADVDYDNSIEEKSLSVAYDLQSRLERASLKEQLDLWTLMGQVFPTSTQIASQLKKTQVSYFSDALKKQVHNKRWTKAMAIIKEIRSLVTHIDLLDLQFDFFTDIDNRDYFSVTEATSVLEDIKAFQPDEEKLAEKEARLVVADALQRSNFNLMSTIQALPTDSEYLESQRNALGRRLNNEYRQDLQNFRENQDYSAMVLTLANMYTISSTLGIEVDQSVRNLIYEGNFMTQVPVIAGQLHVDGRKLINPHNANLQSSIKSYEKLIPFVSGFLKILSDGYRINGAEPIYRQLQVNNVPGSNVSIHELEELNAILGNTLTILRDTDKLVQGLRDQKMWNEAIIASIDGARNSWAALEYEFAQLEDAAVSDFVDIKDLVRGFQIWKSNTEDVSKLFSELQLEFNSDNTQACEEILHKISAIISDAPVVIDSEFTGFLKGFINNRLHVKQYRQDIQHIGIDNIFDINERKEQEIVKLFADIEHQKSIFETINNLTQILSRDKQTWKGNLIKETKLDQGYLDQLNKFLGGLQVDVPNIPRIPNIPTGELSNDKDLQKNSIVEKFIELFKKQPRSSQDSRLSRELKIDFEGITMEDQLEKMREVLQYYEEIQTAIQADHMSSKAKYLTSEIEANNNIAGERKELLIPAIRIADEILAGITEAMKSKDEVTTMRTNKNFNSLAIYLIEISPYIKFDSYLLAQKKIAQGNV